MNVICNAQKLQIALNWLRCAAGYEVSSKMPGRVVCLDFQGFPSELRTFGRIASGNARGPFPFEWALAQDAEQAR